MDGSLTDNTTLSQSGHGSNGNQEVLYISQISRTGNSPPAGGLGHPFFCGVRSLFFYRIYSQYILSPTE